MSSCCRPVTCCTAKPVSVSDSIAYVEGEGTLGTGSATLLLGDALTLAVPCDSTLTILFSGAALFSTELAGIEVEIVLAYANVAAPLTVVESTVPPKLTLIAGDTMLLSAHMITAIPRGTYNITVSLRRVDSGEEVVDLLTSGSLSASGVRTFI